MRLSGYSVHLFEVLGKIRKKRLWSDDAGSGAVSDRAQLHVGEALRKEY